MRDQLRSTLRRRNLVKEENLLGNTKYFIAIGIVSKLSNELEFDTPCIGRVYTLRSTTRYFFCPLTGQ